MMPVGIGSWIHCDLGYETGTIEKGDEMTTINQSASPAQKPVNWIIIAVVGVLGCICVLAVGLVVGLGLGGKLSLPMLSAPVPTFTPIVLPTSTALPTDIPTAIPTSTETPVPLPTATFTIVPTQSLSAMIEALRAAATGSGVSDAAPYDPTKSGVHPIIIFSASKDIVDEWNAELPAAWRGQSVSQTELVALVTNHEIVVEKARYTAKGMGIFFLNRIRIDTEVILREAQTGQTVASFTFPGGDPPTLKSGYNQIITAVYGTFVPYETVELWLKSFVEK
jgi:hypothetical protein